MLKDANAAANIAVKDINTARKYQSGNSTINVYHSDFAGTNKATAMTWDVGDDFDKVMKDLKAKGIKFEHYQMPDTKVEGDVHICHDLKLAWFKDPDGNILSLVSQ